MTFGSGGRDVAGLGFGRLRSPLGTCLRAFAGRAACPFRRHEGTQNVDKVQELPELASRLIQVADHSVLTAADLPVLLPQSGDACLELFQDFQAALRDVTVQCGQPDRRVIEAIETCELVSYRLQFPHSVAERVFPPHVTP
ncbi:hypothetical protein [Streptomyces sp. SID9913]|uniref:hypothetical protein n=1 Tax=Streptomyces sp. SID9913 TaxID=2706117 RepID=UPI001EF38F8F|nr:hypothetical protein [Streptomyces sp. SID9913]